VGQIVEAINEFLKEAAKKERDWSDHGLIPEIQRLAALGVAEPTNERERKAPQGVGRARYEIGTPSSLGQ